MRKKDLIPDLSIWLVGTLVLWLIASFFIENIWISLLIGTNISCFLLYAIDKRLAQTHKRRIPEKSLFISAFFGGSIGALLAMHLFRHKTKKLSFQLVLALLIFVQILFVIWMSNPSIILNFFSF